MEVLKLNQYGRYEIAGQELTCGCVVDVLFDDGWETVCIEHDGEKYYAVGHRGTSLEGRIARLSKN